MKRFSVYFTLLIATGCATSENFQPYFPPSELQEPSTIVISREDAFLYSGISANISLNGNKIGRLAPGGTETFHVPAGRNFVAIRAFGSPGESNLSFNTQKNETYHLLIEPRGGSTLVGGLLGSAVFLALEADGKTGGLFSLKLTSTTVELVNDNTATNVEDELLRLRELFEQNLISEEVYEQRQLELLNK